MTATPPDTTPPTPEAADARVLLIDGHSMAFRAFFALPVENFATTSGQATNAVYGFTSMLLNLVRDFEPTHLMVAWDVSRTSFRTAEYSEYKGTRSATPTEFKGQVSRSSRTCCAHSRSRTSGSRGSRRTTCWPR